MSILRAARARRHPAIWLFSLLACAACAAACSATGTGPAAESNLQTGATSSAGPGPSVAPSSSGTAAPSGATSSSAGPAASSSGPVSSGPVPDASCSSCLEGAVEWGYEGGLRIASEKTRVDPCRMYRRTRTYHSDAGKAPISCSAPLACDDSAAGVAKLKKLVSDPEVQKALSPTMKVFGCDSRPVDGAIFVLAVDGKGSFGVGSECSSHCPAPQAGCTNAPAAVKALRDYANSLDEKMKADAACKALATP